MASAFSPRPFSMGDISKQLGVLLWILRLHLHNNEAGNDFKMKMIISCVDFIIHACFSEKQLYQ
jgi:hypothetical protein